MIFWRAPSHGSERRGKGTCVIQTQSHSGVKRVSHAERDRVKATAAIFAQRTYRLFPSNMGSTSSSGATGSVGFGSAFAGGAGSLAVGVPLSFTGASGRGSATKMMVDNDIVQLIEKSHVTKVSLWRCEVKALPFRNRLHAIIVLHFKYDPVDYGMRFEYTQKGLEYSKSPCVSNPTAELVNSRSVFVCGSKVSAVLRQWKDKAKYNSRDDNCIHFAEEVMDSLGCHEATLSCMQSETRKLHNAGVIGGSTLMLGSAAMGAVGSAAASR